MEAYTNLLTDPMAWATEAGGRALAEAQAFLPKLLQALVLLLLAWGAAWLLRAVILRFGRGLDRLLASLNRATGEDTTRPGWSVTAITAGVAFWVVIALGVVSASEVLGLALLAEWLEDLLGYLPRVLISGFILFIGYLVSQGLRDLLLGLPAIRRLRYGGLLAGSLSGLTLAFALLLALDQLGLDTGLLKSVLIIAVAALAGAGALAFGLGTADTVRNIMASHYLRTIYQPGVLVRMDGREGEILELTPVGVLLETAEGREFIPARRFLEQGAVIVDPEEDDGA